MTINVHVGVPGPRAAVALSRFAWKRLEGCHA
ncbi:hypothetical protein Deipe_1858 [Deinococcus peraridilitoris DSM 19664]|uniref:Uncharacterized protein n=1 Tax=Deinococcus peraridilitoris (strain DSM 19664 / LMG 22246 / CIP 109416 / KR-200) TaxID=937777 RepID=L0A1P6_DEIPD|nr:hypothetical protein Deipe_1858 [Deinococcus peraridilitoris DSM 19664]